MKPIQQINVIILHWTGSRLNIIFFVHSCLPLILFLYFIAFIPKAKLNLRHEVKREK